MMTSVWETVWERVRALQHTVIVGQESIPQAPDDMWVLLVRCNAPWTTGGPLDEACHRVAKLLGVDIGHVLQAHKQLEVGVRSRLLHETPGRASEAVFVEMCNRLASWADGKVALGFEAVDATDEATVIAMTQILRHKGWLQLPMILAVRSVAQGAVSTLVQVLRETYGAEAVLDMTASVPPGDTSASFDWGKLPADVLRVLRAGSVIGAEFEAELVARLLNEPVGAVLETLQRAADAGIVLADRGEGRFAVSPEAIQILQSQLLPSLQAFWHARLGTLLSERRPSAQQASVPQGRDDDADAWGPGATAAPEETKRVRMGKRSPAAYAALYEPVDATVAPEETADVPEDTATPETTVGPSLIWSQEPRAGGGRAREEAQPVADQVRAAAHLQAAGQAEAAVEQYLAAVREVASRGNARRAYTIAQQALTLLDDLPASEPRALLRAQLLLELGQVQWHSAVLGTPFTLHDALESFAAAKAALPETAAASIAGQLAAVTAGVCYDLGDLETLQQALAELTTVGRRLLDAGNPMGAARLLNEQAALFVRMGDPVRATHLLTQSRRLFDEVLRTNPGDSRAAEALAASEHLLARLPLHTRIRPGHEEEAYAISLDHALAAEGAYERLNQPWQVARVWETIGRLEMARGRPEAARGRLTTALQLQRQIGDITGLARSTAALADLCIASGQLGEATTLLSDSVALNFEKGSPIGLAFNRRAFDALRHAVGQAHGAAGSRLHTMLEEVERRFAQAEAVLGKVNPPEP
jgi:tetratricopeptide (TPR) repeat protein